MNKKEYHDYINNNMDNETYKNYFQYKLFKKIGIIYHLIGVLGEVNPARFRKLSLG